MKSEAQVQQEIRLAASQRGIVLMRNNSGACTDMTGRLVRYGLGNDSEKINRVRKSSDLIGWTPVIITPDMIGRKLAVFTAIECKAEGWRRTPSDKRAEAQAAFGQWVTDAGGIFRFASSMEDVW